MEFLTETFNSFMALMKTFSFFDLIDIIVMSFIIYNFIKLIRETRASQLVKGILILLVAYFFAYQLNLRMVMNMLNNFFQFGIIALLVVFQPELRRALEQLGRSKFSRYWLSGNAGGKGIVTFESQEACINSVVDASMDFQKTKTGALIVFERETKLGDVINTGTIVDATPSVPILGNIFFNKAPLHDGAVIIRNGSVYAAGCILPLTKNENISLDLGTRHRAALGISENSDAVCVVVSEETGTISIALDGVITRNYSKDRLKSKLYSLILNYSEDEKKKTLLDLIKRRKNEKK